MCALASGCGSSWSRRPIASLHDWQPEELRQAQEAAHPPPPVPTLRRRHRPEPAPSELEIGLRSGEVLWLREPYMIAETEPGVFRVSDARTPERTIPLTQVEWVGAKRPRVTVGDGIVISVALLAAASVVTLLFLGLTTSPAPG